MPIPISNNNGAAAITANGTYCTLATGLSSPLLTLCTWNFVAGAGLTAATITFQALGADSVWRNLSYPVALSLTAPGNFTGSFQGPFYGLRIVVSGLTGGNITYAELDASLDSISNWNQLNVATMVLAAAKSVTNMFVFGDSLLEGGNIKVISDSAGTNLGMDPPGYVSNGPPYATLVANLIGVPNTARYANLTPLGQNYAVSGATVQTAGTTGFNLVDQVNQFLIDVNGKAPAGSAALCCFGTNDSFLTPAQMSLNITMLQTQINRLVSAGIKQVIVANIQIQAFPGANNGAGSYNQGTDGTGTTNGAVAWNAQQAAMIAATPAAVLFDVNSIYQAAYANPTQFGFSDTVGGNQLTTAHNSFKPYPDSYIFFSQSIHPSGAMHRLIAQSLFTLLATTYGQSYQTLSAQNSFGATQYTASKRVVVPTYNVTDTGVVLNNDDRLELAASATVSPQNIMRFHCDWEEGVVSPPPYTWVVETVGTGSLVYKSSLASFVPNTFGICQYQTIASGDIIGQCVPSCVFPATQQGGLDITVRFGMTFAAGDNLDLFIGLMDVTTGTLLNGMYFFLPTSTGTIHNGAFFAKKANANTSVTIPDFVVSADTMHTLRAVTNAAWTMVNIFLDGVWVAQGALTPPIVPLIPRIRNLKISVTSLTSSFDVDSFTVNYRFPRL
jgi:phospholipase/lecithinase/hemolysin